MNKKTKANTKASSDKLSFRRETIRTLSADESARVLGGKMCQPESCNARSCPGSICTITIDETM